MSDTFVTCEFPQGASTADTAGWDTVYAMNVPVINAALADYFGPNSQHAAQMAFNQSLDSANSATMTGRFGAWQITTGGAGTTLHLSLPFASGTATLQYLGPQPITVDLTGASARVAVTLGFHPVPQQAASALPGSVTAQLKVATNGQAPASGSAADIVNAASAQSSTAPSSTGAADSVADDPVTVIGIDNLTLPSTLESGLQTLASTFIQTLVKMWVSDNMWIFDYVFLSVDVAETADNGEWAWIRPAYVGYAYTDLLDADGQAQSIDNSVFAILSLTAGSMQGNAPAPGRSLSQTVSVNAIPNNPGVNASFVIAPQLLMSQILLPNMATLFQGAAQSDFVTGSDGLSVSNQNPLTLQLQLDPKWYNGIYNPCTATIGAGDLSVTLDDTDVTQLFSNISFPYGAQNEVTVTLTLGSSSTIGLDADKQFTMQYGTTNVSTLSVQPDAQKVAAEALESIGVNLVTTAVLCFAGFGAAGETAGAAAGETAGTAAGETAGTTGTVTQTAEAGEGTGAAETGETLSQENQQLADNLTDEVGEGNGTQPGSVTVPPQTETVSVNQIGSDVGQGALAEMRNPGTWSLKGIMPRFTFKIWAMFVGQIGGQIYSNMSNIDMIEAYGQDPSKMPTLENFLANCIQPATWTNTGPQTLACAGLNGAFIMGFTVPNAAQGS